jgi:hypothetical protein
MDPRFSDGVAAQFAQRQENLGALGVDAELAHRVAVHLAVVPAGPGDRDHQIIGELDQRERVAVVLQATEGDGRAQPRGHFLPLGFHGREFQGGEGMGQGVRLQGDFAFRGAADELEAVLCAFDLDHVALELLDHLGEVLGLDGGREAVEVLDRGADAQASLGAERVDPAVGEDGGVGSFDPRVPSGREDEVEGGAEGLELDVHDCFLVWGWFEEFEFQRAGAALGFFSLTRRREIIFSVYLCGGFPFHEHMAIRRSWMMATTRTVQ